VRGAFGLKGTFFRTGDPGTRREKAFRVEGGLRDCGEDRGQESPLQRVLFPGEEPERATPVRPLFSLVVQS
jgi:hypothetical protein